MNNRNFEKSNFRGKRETYNPKRDVFESRADWERHHIVRNQYVLPDEHIRDERNERESDRRQPEREREGTVEMYRRSPDIERHEEHPGRGWFGDHEGHADAALRGWRMRGRSENSRRRTGAPDNSKRGWSEDSQGYSTSRSRAERNRNPRVDDHAAHANGMRKRSSMDVEGRDANRLSGSKRRSRTEPMKSKRRPAPVVHKGRGWFGDPEEHAEAAHRGWLNRNHR